MRSEYGVYFNEDLVAMDTHNVDIIETEREEFGAEAWDELHEKHDQRRKEYVFSHKESKNFVGKVCRGCMDLCAKIQKGRKEYDPLHDMASVREWFGAKEWDMRHKEHKAYRPPGTLCTECMAASMEFLKERMEAERMKKLAEDTEAEKLRKLAGELYEKHDDDDEEAPELVESTE